jgi:hypothetical protein
MDVKSSFLNGSIKEEVYVKQPSGFESEKYPNVYKLHKVLYGLKQVSKAWYEYLRDFLIDNGFKIGKIDSVTSPPLKRMVSPNQDHYGVPLPK